jgi:hypothetical protein
MSTIKLQSKPNTIEVRPLPADGGRVRIGGESPSFGPVR